MRAIGRPSLKLAVRARRLRYAMLLITDRGDRSRVGRKNCTVVLLGEPFALPASPTAITCDVALDDAAIRQALRQALGHLRATSAPKIHFILRHFDIAAHALANALGATSISVETETRAAPAGSPPTLVEARDEPTRFGRPSVEDDIASVAASLMRIFGAAVSRTAIARDDLDEGVAALLRSTREAGISCWVEIVQRYDDATYQHCLLVAGLTAAFAVQLGLTTGKQRMLVQAALLHDIGKARVPLETLNKAGPLTFAEQTQMRRHPTDGYCMLTKQSGLEPGVLDIVLHHHELLDGSGYPDGLRREQIADVVRIVTICDIQAALIERRPYRKPMEAEDAYNLLLAMGGKLDATLVAAFGSIVDAMRGDGSLPQRSSA